MKRFFLVVLALAASGGFGYWLVRTPHTQREILLACAGWVLGFWVAAAIQGRRGRDADAAGHDEADLAEDDEADWEEEWEEEDWDEEEDEV